MRSGATTINIPRRRRLHDADVAAVVQHLRRARARIERLTLSVHCHDDLGDRSGGHALQRCRPGQRQVECTRINGVGERAGDCSLEKW